MTNLLLALLALTSFLPERPEATFSVRGELLKAGYKDDRESHGALAVSPDADLRRLTIDRKVSAMPDAPDVTEHHLSLSLGTDPEKLGADPNETREICIERMHSLYFSQRLPENAQVTVETCYGEWSSEWGIATNLLQRGQTLTIRSSSGIRGAWGNRPTFCLRVSNVGDRPQTIGDRPRETVYLGALEWSGMWEIEFTRDVHDLLIVQGGASTEAGCYRLKRGQTLKLPNAVVVRSTNGVTEATAKLHDWARIHCLPHPNRTPWIAYNSWEGTYFKINEEKALRQIRDCAAIGCELYVLDDGWFGRGKYARNNPGAGLGDWFCNPEKFPHGLKGLADAAEASGLKFGLWVEPEMVNTNSELYAAHPDWVIRTPGRPIRVGRGGSQAVLDLSKPAVRDFIVATLDRLIDETGGRLAYFKWDANANLMDVPNGNLPVDYVNGLYEVLGRFRAQHPNVIIQACASGGGRADYGMLHFADEFWASDNTDAFDRRRIQSSALRYFPPETMAAHVTKVPNAVTKRFSTLDERFTVARQGRLGVELDLTQMSPAELAELKRRIAEYKSGRCKSNNESKSQSR